MHSAALHLAPVLAAEKSKVPFYIAGGALVVWALIVSLGLGLRRPNFPSNLQAERATIAVTVVLVLAAVSTAVLTSGSAAKAGEAAGGSAKTTPESAPEPSAAAPTTSTATSQPTATTGTPAKAKQPAPKAKTKTKAKAPAGTTPPPSASTSLALVANPAGQLSYDTKTLSAKTGSVTISLKNNAPLEHNVTISQGSKVLGATPSFISGTRKVTIKLSPGTYTFYCSVPGHRAAGMVGKLVVQP
jgi:plastocyanin